MIGELERVLFDSDRMRNRIIRALAVVAKSLQQSRRPYIAFSGGKDSIALTALVHRINPDIPLVWSDDELEYPESVTLMTNLQAVAGDQLTIMLGHTTHANWFRPWESLPYWREPLPGSIVIDLPVDEWQAGLGYDLTFTGLRMDENRRRRDWLIQSGPRYRVTTGTLARCCPLWDWTADDVWALIAGWGLPYNAVYDQLDAIHVPRDKQRVGPLPLARRTHLQDGWPDLLAALEDRYGPRWE